MIAIAEENKNEIAQGIHFHFMEGNKFKTTVVTVLLRTRITRETATKTALLAEVLKNGSSKYETKQKIQIKTEEMDGSVFDVSVIKKGEEQILFFYLEFLKGKKELMAECIQFLNEVILNPLVVGQGFEPVILNRAKESLRSQIKMRMDQKKEYAMLKCIEIMCEKEPFGIYGQGYEKDLDKIDGKDLYCYYKEILETAPIEIIVSGDRQCESEYFNLFQKFHINKRQYKKIDFQWKMPQIKEIKEKIEKRPVLQGKLCVGFRCESDPIKEFPELLIYNEILGAGASSRLFKNVREKESLCYYINSILYRFKSIIVVQSGIEASQFKKAACLVQDTIEELKKSIPEENELNNAKNSLLKHFNSLKDNQTGIMDFYMNEYLLNVQESLEHFIKKIQNVKPEDILRIAKQVHLDTIYFLSPKKGE